MIQAKPVTKESLAKMCADARMSLEDRFSYRGYEVFLAYGLSLSPEKTFFKFGVEPGDHPNGAYGALFSIFKGEEKLVTGGCVVWDIFANTELPVDERKKKRLDLAATEAKALIDKLIQEKRRLH